MDTKRIYEDMKTLVAVPGVSGTDSEKETSFKLAEMLREIPYFQEHPENVMMVPVNNDPLGRSIVAAYLELNPDCPDTIILTGHYDVVDVEEFGHLQDIAYDVEEITKRINEMPLDADSKADFESGEWIFGRGTADMKYGHALCLELLRHYAKERNIRGNLLYVAVCGEETNSEGMLRATSFFNDFAEKKGLNYKCLLLTECYMMEDQAGDTNRYIHYGASGKVMPMFFFIGESTHGGEPFLGIDPTSMATEVYKRLQLNTEYCQQSLGETTPPPVCLKMQDLKTTYSASLPLYSVSYYTFITVDLKPEELMNKLKGVAYESMGEAIKSVENMAQSFSKLIGEPTVRYQYEPCVMTFAELLNEVSKTYEGDLKEHLRQYAQELLVEKKEMQSVAVYLVKHVYELYKDKRPMVILSVIPPYYPDVYLSKEEKNSKELMDACDEIIAYAKEEYGETLKMKDYYMGISDMCYTGLNPDQDFDQLFENLVGVGSIYDFPVEDMKKFRVPGIVLGGYGKDFHKHTERLHKRYNFKVLPDLYIKLIDNLLK